MTDEKPIEPSAIFAADGSRVSYRGGPKPAETSSAFRPLLPALVRAATSGPLLTASVLARTGVAAATAAEAAGWMAWQGAWAAIDASRGQRAVPEDCRSPGPASRSGDRPERADPGWPRAR